MYREGFETVLFYQALYASAATQSLTVTAGFIAGAVALACVYVAFRRFQVHIPIQQFFFVTGLLLYMMAAVFAGQGVHELQDAGIIGVTSVRWMPAIPLLGVFPSLESANIAYKLLARLGNAKAIGPILLGTGAPIHVLQIGDEVDSIVQVAAVAAMDAMSRA